MLTVYIGYDKREPIAYEVLEYTIQKYASTPINIHPLKLKTLTNKQLITRPITTKDGVMVDLISKMPQSTEFAITRFLTPIIHQSGWAIFMDCDMILMDDINKIIPLLDDSKAVMVVKHDYVCNESSKMDHQPQTQYHKKNWSSFIAFNCDHPSNSKLTLTEINNQRGLWLHQFGWLHDDEIGELSPQWNWLVNVTDKPDDCIVAHFTLGGPWFENWQEQPYDWMWLDQLEYYQILKNR